MVYRQRMRLLTINSGSSSLKVALYEMVQPLTRLLSGQAERIGHPASRLQITDADGNMLLERQDVLPDHDAALDLFVSWLSQERPGLVPQAAGHRVVHGGSAYREPHVISASLLTALRNLVPIDDQRAAAAIDLFCYQARKFLGALAAVLGGLDTLVFTGGIGEHAAPVRASICAGLAFLGIVLDPQRNEAHAPVISRDGGAVTVRVLRTDEDLMIARHTSRLLRQKGTNDVSV